MAETKTRSSTRKPRKAKSSSKKSRPQAKSRAKPRGGSSKAGPNGARVNAAKKAVEHTAKEAGGTVGKAAGKAKLPLVAGGAALAGAVGGVALGAHQARRHRGLSGAMPQVKVDSHDVASAARQVGAFGAQMGRLASELQSAREANGSDRHRSPVEVVLDGLTARRGA